MTPQVTGDSSGTDVVRHFEISVVAAEVGSLLRSQGSKAGYAVSIQMPRRVINVAGLQVDAGRKVLRTEVETLIHRVSHNILAGLVEACEVAAQKIRNIIARAAIDVGSWVHGGVGFAGGSLIILCGECIVRAKTNSAPSLKTRASSAAFEWEPAAAV